MRLFYHKDKNDTRPSSFQMNKFSKNGEYRLSNLEQHTKQLKNDKNGDENIEEKNNSNNYYAYFYCNYVQYFSKKRE